MNIKTKYVFGQKDNCAEEPQELREMIRSFPRMPFYDIRAESLKHPPADISFALIIAFLPLSVL